MSRKREFSISHLRGVARIIANVAEAAKQPIWRTWRLSIAQCCGQRGNLSLVHLSSIILLSAFSRMSVKGTFEGGFMEASIGRSLNHRRLFPRIVITILALVIFSVAPAAFAQSGREQVEGVKNFGRVTD